MFDSVKRRNL